MEDSYRLKGLRRNMIETLKTKGIRNTQLLEIMGKIPRHFFLDKAFADWAYKDQAFPIGKQQTISQPYTVAIQTLLLNIKSGDRVLEVGTGSGYQAAVLFEMGARVYTIERQEYLYKKASRCLQEMGYEQIRCFYGDGYQGLPKFAPFDKILVTAGATEIPIALKQQLAIGGIMVIPVGTRQVQRMLRITRVSETNWEKEEFGDFQFVPLLQDINPDQD